MFKKKCKVSDTKLRRHLRLINAGKTSKVFEPQSDDEDEDDEHESIQAFLNEFSQVENSKKLLENKERENEFEERVQIAILEKTEDQENIIRDRVQLEIAKKTEELKRKFDQRVKISVDRQVEQNKENVQELIDAALNAEREKIRKEEVERILSSTKKHMEVEMSKISVFKKNEIEQESPRKTVSKPTILKKRKIESETVVLNKFVQLSKQERNYDNEIYEEESENYPSAMEEEYIENDENSDIFTITVNENEDNNDECIIVEARSKNRKSSVETVIPDDVEPDVDDEYMDYENDYQSDQSDKDDEPDMESITKAVKATLAQQSGFDETCNYELKFTRKSSILTQVEVIVEDGTTIIMDIQTAMKKEETDENGEIKIFKCHECPKSFSRRNQLQRHTSVHNQDGRGITCMICEKWFPSKSSLDRHMRIHTGEKPFKCEICGRAFIQKEILKRHLLVHTGEKNFVCTFPDCAKKFSQSDMLKQHVNRKHNSTDMMESHKCTLCDKVNFIKEFFLVWFLIFVVFFFYFRHFRMLLD